MTDDKPARDREPQEEYDPETDHLCDGYINYLEDVTISLSNEDGYDQIQEVAAECQVCGRQLTLVVDVGPTWLRTIDKESGEILHEY